MKTVLFIPGRGEDINARDYPATIHAIEKKGYRVVFVPLKWDRTTIKQWTKEFLKSYERYDPAETILAGFSWGAMTAFIAAIEKAPHELWLFSLSPYFHEDIHAKGMKQAWLTSIGHRRVSTFDELSFQQLIKKMPFRTLFFYGTAELENWPDINYRHKAVSSHKNMKTILIKDAKHDVTSDVYIEAIEKEI